jgi:branched-chain amino acid transport system substrate-binding protein
MLRKILATLAALVTFQFPWPDFATHSTGYAQQRIVKIGMSLPITGADADEADAVRKGAEMAIQEINAKGGVAGYKLEAVLYDSATPAAGQSDPVQAATNYKKFIGDSMVLAAVGPMWSGEGKAIAPIVSEADMATITPSSTNPDITDPKFKSQYRPKGKAVFFRNVPTDNYQAPNMADHAWNNLKVRTVYILDDGATFGMRMADGFQKRAIELGMNVLGRDRLDPSGTDYVTVLSKIKGMNAHAIYYGGTRQTGVKLARQAHGVMPTIHKLGSSGIYDPEFPKQAEKNAAEGWWVSSPSPNLLSDTKTQAWIDAFKIKNRRNPTESSLLAYNAVFVIADATERTVRANKPLNRSNLRDAIQATSLNNTLQGTIEYDENGDIRAKLISQNKLVSIYQVKGGQFIVCTMCCCGFP